MSNNQEQMKAIINNLRAGKTDKEVFCKEIQKDVYCLVYPVFGDFVTMYSNSSVIGNCRIGNNVVIGANTCIKDEDIPDNCLVFGSSPNLVIKQKTEKEMEEYFCKIWKV